MTAIVGLMGKAQAGKDTLAKHLVDDHGFIRLAFADALREMLYALNPIVVDDHYDGVVRVQRIVQRNGWDRAKTQYPEIRELLQRLGTEAGRNVLGQDVWIDAVRDQIKGGSNYVITDVRFPNEFELVHRWPGPGRGYTVKVIRPGNEGAGNHVSETALDEHEVDAVVFNDGPVERLRETATALAGAVEQKALPAGKL